MRWLRGVFLENWRNKGIALFFAVAIWVVAFQSERQSLSDEFRVEFAPEDASAQVITALRRPPRAGEEGGEKAFEGRVQIELSGPRKQIEELVQRVQLSRAPFRIPVPPESEVYHTFSRKDFELERTGITIESVWPSGIRIAQDRQSSITMSDLESRVSVTEFPRGYEVVSTRVEPSTVTIRGPESILASVGLSIPYAAGNRLNSESEVDVEVHSTDESNAELVAEFVKVVPRKVKVTVVLQRRTATFALDAVPVTFIVPPPQVPIRILSDDLGDGSIPVEFRGPQDQIERLKTAAQDPAFSVSVRVPRLQPGEETVHTFTEEILELYDFPGVQMRQHPTRRDEKKGPWTYQVVPVTSETGN